LQVNQNRDSWAKKSHHNLKAELEIFNLLASQMKSEDLDEAQFKYREQDHQAYKYDFNKNQDLSVLLSVIINGPKQEHTEADCELRRPVVGFDHVVCFRYLQR
jgi:hypothetical protein